MHTVLRGRSRRCAMAVSLAIATISCTDTIAPAIEIVLSQPTVDLRAIRGTSAPVAKTITVENGGDGRLGPVNCPANPAPWLTCAVSSGNAVTLTANPAGLTASPAAASVPITAAGAPDKPQSVEVHLIIDQPVLTVSASSVNFTSSEAGGGTSPGSATVTVTNTGAGTLTNLGAITCVPTPANARVSCVVNQSSGVLTLSVDPSGLAPATYIFPVIISAPNDNVSKTVSVTLAMAAVPRIGLSRQSLVFQMLRGAAAPAPQTVTVTNIGGGTLGAVTCPANPAQWLTCAVSGGGSTLTFSVNPTGLTANPAPVNVSVTATGAINSPQTIAVNLNIQQPVLSVSATSVAFTAIPGGTTTSPANEVVTVTNTGEGSLAALGAISCTPPDQSPVTCTVDQNAGTLTFTTNPVGVVGTQLYPVVVGAENSGVTRTITVSLSAPPTVVLSATELNFLAVRGETQLQAKKITVTNGGNGTLGAVTCQVPAVTWLICSVVGNELTFTVNPTGMTASPSDVEVDVSAVGAFNNPRKVKVTLTIRQPMLAVNTTLVPMTITAGQSASPTNIKVSNPGTTELSHLGVISCTPSDAHITSCVVNQINGDVTLTVNTATAPALLAGSTHVFSVVIDAPIKGNTSQTITLVVTVQ